MLHINLFVCPVLMSECRSSALCFCHKWCYTWSTWQLEACYLLTAWVLQRSASRPDQAQQIGSLHSFACCSWGKSSRAGGYLCSMPTAGSRRTQSWVVQLPGQKATVAEKGLDFVSLSGQIHPGPRAVLPAPRTGIRAGKGGGWRVGAE